MPEIIRTETTVYTLDELTALDAADGPGARRREKAIDAMVDKLVEWWDSSDIEEINETITYALGVALKTPGWDTYGEADFPGIGHGTTSTVKLQGWDLDRGQNIQLDGTLTRENAPALPWVDGIEEVTLTAGRDYTSVGVMESDVDATEEEYQAMRDAVSEAMHTAWKAGRDQAEYLTSAKYALEHIEANERRFLEDGSFYG